VKLLKIRKGYISLDGRECDKAEVINIFCKKREVYLSRNKWIKYIYGILKKGEIILTRYKI
jgi:hypothetical protein